MPLRNLFSARSDGTSRGRPTAVAACAITLFGLVPPVGAAAPAAVTAPIAARATGTECDFDGDGYGDLAVRLPGYRVGDEDAAGAIDIFYGSPRGLSGDRGHRITQNDAAGGVSQSGDLFGFATACGDSDNDGYTDLVVGSPGDTDGAGRIDLWLGSPNGLTTNGTLLLPAVPTDAGDRLGEAITFATLNGPEARNQIVVGAPGAMLGRGTVYVLGSSRWRGLFIITNRSAGWGFGSSLASGDIDGDGRADLAVGAPLGGLGTVTALIGIDAQGAAKATQTYSPNGEPATRRYGTRVALADLDGDGGSEIIVGDPGPDDASGLVEVLSLTAAGVLQRRTRYDNSHLMSDDSPGIGTAFVLADFNGDGPVDLAVGFPTADVAGQRDAGAIAVLSNLPAGDTRPSPTLIDQGSHGIKDKPERFDLFGFDLEAGDFDGDGASDLAAYAPGDHGSRMYAGHVQTIKGSPTGLTPRGDAKLTVKTVGPGQRNAYFAWTVNPATGEERAGPSVVVEQLIANPETIPVESTSPYGRLLTLIEAADEGSEILLALYRLDPGSHLVASLLDALRSAKSERRVAVQIAIDDNSLTGEVVTQLLDMGFGVHICERNCVGGDSGAQHGKFMVFSSVDGVATTVTSTANWTGAGLAGSYEATLVVREFDHARQPIFTAHRERFTDFVTSRLSEGDAFRTVRNGNVQATFFPQLEGDVVADSLNAIDLAEDADGFPTCDYVNALGETRTVQVRVAVSRADGMRPEIAQRLIELHQAGCHVQIMAQAGAMPLLDQLADGGFPVSLDGSGDQTSSGAWCVLRQHAKELTISGPFEGAITKVAWVGSHNLELANLRNASDTWVRVDETSVFRKLNEHMATMFNEVVACP